MYNVVLGVEPSTSHVLDYIPALFKFLFLFLFFIFIFILTEGLVKLPQMTSNLWSPPLAS